MSVLIVSKPEVKYWIVGGRRFLLSPHPHGDDLICEVCGESNYFSGHATLEGIEKDLTEHRCEDQKDLRLGVAGVPAGSPSRSSFLLGSRVRGTR